MATATAERPMPNLEIYDFRTAFNEAFAAAVVAASVKKTAVQGSNDLLNTPRIETRFTLGRQEQRSFIVQGTNTGNTNPPTPWTYQNLFAGSFEVNAVTSRIQPDSIWAHNKLASLIMWLMEDHINTLTKRMKYLTVIQVLCDGAKFSYEELNQEDHTAFSFSVKFNIQPTAFPKPNQ